MSRGVNKVILVGNVGQDPIMRVIHSTTDLVGNFQVATGNEWKDKLTGEKKGDTEWHKIITYNKLAELTEKYIKKGTKIYIEGMLKTRKWTDKQGVERYATEIIANNIELLGSKDNPSQNKVAKEECTVEDYKNKKDNYYPPIQNDGVVPSGINYDDIPF